MRRVSEDSTNNLIRLSRDLVEVIEQLREALLDYKEGCEELLSAGDGEPADTTVESLSLLKFGEKRARVAQAMEDFESARRLARVALIAVAQEEGSNLSDVARVLGVSRQLTSRLARGINGKIE